MAVKRESEPYTGESPSKIEKAGVATFTLSREEIQREAEHRVNHISKEFTEGFKFLENYPKSVTFFGGSQYKPDNKYYQRAEELAGRIVRELDYAVVSGGGPGIMEAANKGAKLSDGESLGLTIKLPREQISNEYISKELAFYYFFTRKVCLSFSAEAFIFFPGGYGTLDEFFELLTLIQTKKIEGVPLICYGESYWNKLKDFITEEMLESGTIDKKDLELFYITDNMDEIIEIIKKVPVKHITPFEGNE